MLIKYTSILCFLIAFCGNAQHKKSATKTASKDHTSEKSRTQKVFRDSIFVANATRVGVPLATIRNIIAAREKRDQELKAGTNYRKESERNSTIPLQDYDLEKSQINKRFGAYIATQLTYEQYKQLFQEQMQPQIERAVDRKLEELETMAKDTNNLHKPTREQLYKKEMERLITANYYHYDKKLMQKQLALLEPESKDQNEKKALKKSKITIDSTGFVLRAKQAGINERQIADLWAAKAKETEALMAYKKFLNDSKRTHGVAYIDPTYDKKYIAQQYQKSITKILNKKQFRKFYYPIVKEQIARKKIAEWANITRNYEITEQQKEKFQHLINKYSEAIVLTEHYYGYDDRKKITELTTIRQKAQNAYKKNIKQLGIKNKTLVIEQQPAEYQDFIKKARNAGVAEKNITEIVQILDKRAIAFENISTLKKRYTGSIIALDELEYSSSSVRDSFKKSLTKRLTLSQYKVIFKPQIDRLVARKIPSKMREIIETYTPTPSQVQEIRELVQKRLFKNAATASYYGYDDKVAKQQLRALQFRDQSSYQKQLKQLLAQEQ